MELAKRIEILAVEVRGGNWAYYDREYFERTKTEGIYVAVAHPEKTPEAVVTTHYKVVRDGKVGITRLDKPRRSDPGQSLYWSYPLLSMPLRGNLYGLFARVELEEGSPVLRYIEVRSKPNIDYESLLRNLQAKSGDPFALQPFINRIGLKFNKSDLG